MKYTKEKKNLYKLADKRGKGERELWKMIQVIQLGVYFQLYYLSFFSIIIIVIISFPF